ncbi:LysM peptidoglycan-binding domain-containing protein [Desulfoplanes sp.]
MRKNSRNRPLPGEGAAAASSLIYCLAILSMIAASAGPFCPHVLAAPPRLYFSKNAPPPSSISYTVKPGDHLYAIIREQGVPQKNIPEVIERIRTLNPAFDPDQPIHPGQVIRLPLPEKTQDKGSGPPSRKKRPDPLSRSTPPNQQTTYTFKRGDTLFGVLQRITGMGTQQIIHTYMDRFLSSNPTLTNINLVHPGQTIAVPHPAGSNLPEEENASVLVRKVVAPSPLPPSDRPIHGHLPPDQAKIYTTTFLERLGFTVTPGKAVFFPRPGKGWLRIETTPTPIMEAPWGQTLVLVPRSKSERFPKDIGTAGLFPCVVPDNWYPRSVMRSLAQRFPEKISLYPANAAVERDVGSLHITLQNALVVTAMWSSPQKTSAFLVTQEGAAAFPPPLAPLLDRANITLNQWRKTANNRLCPIPRTAINPGDIYIPSVFRGDLPDLAKHRQGTTFPVPGLPPLPGILPQPTNMTLHWRAGKARISLRTRTLGLATEECPIILLDPEMKAPYLVALLGLKGISCYLLENGAPDPPKGQ